VVSPECPLERPNACRRLAIQGGGSPGGAGISTPGLTPSRMNATMKSSPARVSSRSSSSQNARSTGL
jgi:hypothetical protein